MMISTGIQDNQSIHLNSPNIRYKNLLNGLKGLKKKELFSIKFLFNNILTSCAKANSAGTYLLKVNNRNTRTWCETCSKLTIKVPERRRGRISFIVDFEHVIAGWEIC